MNLPNWSNNKTERVQASLNDVKNKRDKAYRYYDFAKKQLTGQGDEDIIYTNVYDSIRIACEAILLLKGKRVRSSILGHHFIVIAEAEIIIAKGLENEFLRFQKMRQKRNKLEYGDLASISESELSQMMTDNLKLLKKINELILENEATLPI